MSILTIDSNKKLISVITAIKLNNMNEEPFVPNFDVSKNNKMDFIRFSIPEGFSNLYLESTLPEGGFIEMNEGFALTASIPSGEQHLIFNYENNVLTYIDENKIIIKVNIKFLLTNKQFIMFDKDIIDALDKTPRYVDLDRFTNNENE